MLPRPQGIEVSANADSRQSISVAVVTVHAVRPDAVLSGPVVRFVRNNQDHTAPTVIERQTIRRRKARHYI